VSEAAEPNEMTPERFVLLRGLFARASELPAHERAAFVERESGEDAALRRQVMELLAASDDVGSRFNPDKTTMGRELLDLPRDEVPPEIGPYRVGPVIGRGGMGVVYEAEQKNPQRRVALKIIKLGMDTAQVVARFEQERQALAILNHPNIAKVLDAGATETGRPYFVMEFVQGVPIAEYCDANKLSIEERLALFDQVCQAVQHAHTKGIIHRDLKPSNVLVSTQDGKATAKVIDFGVAKATASKLTERTLFTEHQQLIGTPEYMSPEQAEGSLDIDTRTDVYSLGVLLYELLTGTTPFDSRSLRSAAYGEIQRIIREVEPPKPSTRLSQSKETLAGVAAKRHTEPGRLASTIRGELDWIVMKALEKDRQRRYETANGLAMDIRRYLSGEAVVAAPPSRTYQVKKFVRRNKGLVSALGAIGISLAVGVIAFAWQARIAGEQRDAAVAARAEIEKGAAELKQVSDFQAKMLSQVDPTQAGKELSTDVLAQLRASLEKAGVSESERNVQMGSFESQWKKVNTTDAARDLIDRTILRPAIKAIDAQFKDQPVVDATLRQALADRYGDLGLLDDALLLQREALAIRRRVLGDDNKATLSSLNNLATILQDQGKLAESEVVAREVLERKRRVLGEEHEDTIVAIGNMGTTLYFQGKLDEAAVYYIESLEKARRALGERHNITMLSMASMGTLLYAQGKAADSEVMYREVLRLSREVRGEDAPGTLSAIGGLQAALRGQDKLAEAEPLARESAEKMRRVLGESHPRTLIAISELDILLQSQGKYAEAEPLAREALEKQRKLFGDDNIDTLISYNSLAGLLITQKKHAEVAALLAPAEGAARRMFVGNMAPRLGQFLTHLGRAQAATGQVAMGEPRLLEAHAILLKALGPSKKSTRNCTQAIVEMYQARAAAEPGKGFEAMANEWQVTLDASTAAPK
jgi:eukaryotic-like serine/threonine-protein kinase